MGVYVRTSLSRTFPHDSKTGLSLVARSTLSSNQIVLSCWAENEFRVAKFIHSRSIPIVGSLAGRKGSLGCARDDNNGENDFRLPGVLKAGPVAQVARAHP